MFYDILKKKCKENDVSISRLCVDIGLAPSSANRWKNGSTPNKDTLHRIAGYFGVDPEYFLIDNYDEMMDALNEKWARDNPPPRCLP